MNKIRVKSAIVALSLAFMSCSPVGEGLMQKDRKPEISAEDANVIVPSSQGGTSSLDPITRDILKKQGKTIKDYSTAYGFDWRLVLAVMKTESSFDAAAESPRGAVGLMQIMPTTGEEVGRELEIDVAAHPGNNIRAGIYYMSRLYNLFRSADEADRLRLTLAAYNSGVGRIYDAQDVAAYLQENPNKWVSVRDALPLLSKRYYTLHKSVWEKERPRSGWFGSSRETVAYVDKIMNYYDDYRLVLN